MLHLQNSLYSMGINATCKYTSHLPLYYIINRVINIEIQTPKHQVGELGFSFSNSYCIVYYFSNNHLCTQNYIDFK